MLGSASPGTVEGFAGGVFPAPGEGSAPIAGTSPVTEEVPQVGISPAITEKDSAQVKVSDATIRFIDIYSRWRLG